jgi:hypothetical protein
MIRARVGLAPSVGSRLSSGRGGRDGQALPFAGRSSTTDARLEELGCDVRTLIDMSSQRTRLILSHVHTSIAAIERQRRL